MSACCFFHKSFYSNLIKRRDETFADTLLRTEEIVKFQEYWHIFLNEKFHYIPSSIFLASKFALGSFPKQLCRESSPVLFICLYRASYCAWCQSVVLKFPLPFNEK